MATLAQASIAAAAAAAAAPSLGVDVRERVTGWLWRQGIHKPTCTRVAVLVAGLVRTTTVQRGDLTTAVARLHLSPAKDASIARRWERLLADEHLDPERLLAPATCAVMPTLLATLVQTYERASAATGRPDAHWAPPLLIIDETTVRERVHVLVAALAYQGIAVPLSVRVWEQNVPLPAGAYWLHLHAVLSAVRTAIPAPLRAQVVLVGDRVYGIPRLLDLAGALGIHFLVRLKDQTALLLADGQTSNAAAFAARVRRTDGPGQPCVLAPDADAPDVPVAAFQQAQWRRCHVVTTWASGAKAPWILATDLARPSAAFMQYARRWSIERLFLHWKSHGWDLEALYFPTVERVGRLLTGMVLATWWVLAVGSAHTTVLRLAAHAAHTQARRRRQPMLPGCAPAPRSVRSWFARKRRFTWGRERLTEASAACCSPQQCWSFPDWHVPTWQAACANAP